MAQAQLISNTTEAGILAALVRRHLQSYSNNKAPAVRSAVAEILADEALLKEVLYEVVSQAVDRYARRDLTAQRHRAVSAALDVAEGAKALAASSLASLLDFPMRSGTRLHAAVRSEVMETAEHYMSSGAVHVQRGIWLTAVSKKMPDGATPVGRVLDSNALAVLFDAAVKRVQEMGLPYGR